jgi:hypothetical protein
MMATRIFGAAIVFAALTTGLYADTWSKKTKLTFSGPVQIPGSQSPSGVVTLPAGTYIFRLMDSQSSRHIVEVTNVRGDKVFSTILAINDYRINATSKTVMYFTERAAGAPPAVKAWFYPGDNYGQRFVYPKVKAVQLAAAVNQPVPSHEAPVEKVKYAEVPVVVQAPAKPEATYTPQTFEKTDATDTAGIDGEAVKEPEPAAQLPKSASSLQFIGLMGLMMLGASLLLRRFAVQFER